MALTEKQRKIALGVAIIIGVAAVIAGLIVLLVVLLSKEDFCDKPPSLPTQLYVTETDGNVMIKWSQAGYTCNATYFVQYSINGGPQVEVPIADLQHTVIKPPVCSDMLIRLRTVGESGKIGEESLDQNYTVLPVHAYVTNTAVTRTDTGIVASWDKPTGLEACDMNYSVKFTSEFGEFNEQTASKSVTVQEDIFCFYLRVQVSTVVGFSETWFADVGKVNAEDIAANLSISSENPYLLVATWSYHNEDLCSFSYTVTYKFGLESQTSEVSEPRATFDVQYCVAATLSILPSALDGEYTGVASVMVANQNPDKMVLQPVENVKFLMDGLSMAVSWNVHKSLRRCLNLFKVTARNGNLGQEASCQGTSGCAVILSSFCPSTEFIISPRTLQGETVRKTYSC